MEQILRFEAHAFGRPYHAARVRIAARARDTELHTHADFHEFMGVVSGCGEHLLTTGVEVLRPGDVVLVRPSDRHAIRGSAPGGLEFINVAFPNSIWQGFLDLTRTATWSSRGPISVHQPAAVPVFEQALARFQDSPSTYDLIRFWTELLELLRPDEAAAPGVPDWLAKACTAMRAEANLRGGVSRLLELAGVSPAHLSRSMRAAYGITPTAFVTDLRLEHAASLLAATNTPIATIATTCGFTSQSYFTRCFTTTHTLTPTAFRHRAQRAFVP
ncbi:helix-turn-helix domain-containing protein [Kribbella solani]|uniref:AraC family cel operon transcriptional repressor n=1 Tax=Kribbella solani TaxID=236067 RepID=A0A841DHT4_9ACTN|nr:AraC family cel operon transcriptional repressor [Kribbella solani]